MRMNGSIPARRSALPAFVIVVQMLACSAPALARGSAIDPDPASPSLTELLAREEAARARPAAPMVPLAEAVPVPARAPVVSGVVQGGVRQVYPHSGSGVTVLVPGARSR